MTEFLNPDFLKFFLPLFGAVIAWFLNARRQRAWEEYTRKEERYASLLNSLTGFYNHAASSETRKKFLDEYKNCWLYCDDKVILAINKAMSGMIDGTNIPMEKRLEQIGELVVAIREDLLRRTITKKTKLSAKDYQHINPGN